MKMSEIREAVDQDYLKRRLDYDPDTGVFTWKCCEEMPNSWNGRYAGKRAGDVISKGTKKRYTCRRIALFRTKIQEHQLAWLYMTGEWPPVDMEIDHKNRDATDNRWENLRLVDTSINAKNKSMYSRNTSGVTGVHWDKRKNRYATRVTIEGTSHLLGCYTDLEEAKQVVMKFRKENGFMGGSGSEHVKIHTPHEKTLKADNMSGCRFLSWDSVREKWALAIEINGSRVRKRHDTLEEAKRHLKKILDEHPDHPYHGIPIPD